MNTDLLFFCKICREKSRGEIDEVKCTIEHTVKRYRKGEYIASQGDKVSSLYMLTGGKVKTEIIADSGLTLSVEEIAAPYPLASAFLFADNNRFPVDVIALEECELMLVSKESIEKQLAECPEFLRGFMAFIANRVRFLSERLKIFSQRSIKAKMAYYILQREKNGAFELGRSIASLAEYFVTDRPSLSRAISEMARDGIIEFESGKGKILAYNEMKELLG
ncbi:MAG: Crp/Fnr family transcriptional regulator [Tannerellaceae bacterium]|nr:Crp/Fnr family transcriptional regulator [Tannerellaceae bacterium]